MSARNSCRCSVPTVTEPAPPPARFFNRGRGVALSSSNASMPFVERARDNASQFVLAGILMAAAGPLFAAPPMPRTRRSRSVRSRSRTRTSATTCSTTRMCRACRPPSVQDTPQAVTVVSGEVMQQQATTTLGDALKNVPGISIAIGEGGTLAGDQFKIRGFDAKDDVYLDGLRDFAAYTRDSIAYEEVQVLKGPSGLMFGPRHDRRRDQHHHQDAASGRQLYRQRRDRQRRPLPRHGRRQLPAQRHQRGARQYHVHRHRRGRPRPRAIPRASASRRPLPSASAPIPPSPSASSISRPRRARTTAWWSPRRPTRSMPSRCPNSACRATPTWAQGGPRQEHRRPRDRQARPHRKRLADAGERHPRGGLFPRLPLYPDRFLRQHDHDALLQPASVRHRPTRRGAGLVRSHPDAGAHRRQRSLSSGSANADFHVGGFHNVRSSASTPRIRTRIARCMPIRCPIRQPIPTS